MKKFVLVLMLVVLTAFSTVNAFAEISPSAESVTDDAENTSDLDEDGSNTSSTSPQTGVDFTYLYVAIISAAGLAVVSAKKLAEEN